MRPLQKYIDAYNYMGSSEEGIFFIAVMMLVDISEALGISYELLNIILIVFVPSIFILLLALLILEKRKNKYLLFQINSQHKDYGDG